MDKSNNAIISLSFICAILGIIIGIQFKTVKKEFGITQLQRVTELSAQLSSAIAENEALKSKLSDYENSIDIRGGKFELIQKQLNEAREIAGLTSMQGRGIIITMNDSPKKNSSDISAYLVHAEDILSVINELNVAGAEAISINGQRIIGTSSVRCAGSIVNINGVRVASPFIISAIGDPDVLESSLIFPGGVVDSLSPWGIEINIKKLQEVIVPAFEQVIQFKEAKSAETEEVK